VITGISTVPLDGRKKENVNKLVKAIADELLPDDVLKLELSQLGAEAFKSKIIKAKTKI
jgi:hypothetical protein